MPTETVAPVVKMHRSVTKALRMFDADRFRWLDEAAALGPVVAVRMGPLNVWVVTDAGVARTMLVTDAARWIRPPATLVPIRGAVGENLFTQSDKKWAELQPFVAPAFRRKALEDRLAAIDAIIVDEVRALPYDTAIDIELAMSRIALMLAAWVLLGERLEPARADELALHQREVVGWVGQRLGELTGFLPLEVGARARAMKEHRAALNAYADEVIGRASARDDTDDVLGALLVARPGGRALTPEQLRGHVLGLFLAGNETAGAALAWAVVHGTGTPDAWTRLRAHPECAASFADESLRLSPAVWGIPRTPNKPGVTVTADGITTRVRRGQVTTIYLRGINRDARVWPDPLRFDPSRHERGAHAAHGSLLPFGLGPRGCIGQQLALAEMRAVLPALARHGNVVLDGPAVEDPQFALRIRGGLRGHFTRP
jgi:cytochrome P450